MGKVGVEPPRDPGRQRREDDLVEVAAIECFFDRIHWIVPDRYGAFSLVAGSVIDEWERQLEDMFPFRLPMVPFGLRELGMLSRVRDEKVKVGGA